MSFGFGIGPSDFVMLLQALTRLAKILNKEAVESFKRCSITYRTFARVAKYLDSVPVEDNPLLEGTVRHIRRDIARLLREYFHKTKDFQRFLGPHRVRRSLRGAFAKIKWSRHTNALEKLENDLKLRMELLNTVTIASERQNIRIHVHPGFSGFGPIPQPLNGDKFILEDANGDRHLIPFRDLPNWEHLHEFLLRVFPADHRGHSTVAMGSYLLHNANTRKDILPSSPSVKPLREVISLDERIEMSVIFRYKDSYNARCPRCNTRRRRSRSLVVKCLQCPLLLRFVDSFEDEVDPLTKIAIDDIKESGLRAFVTTFEAEIERRGYLNSNISERELKNMVSRNFQDAVSVSCRGASPELPDIRVFRRVTLCLPHWPSVGQDPTFQRADAHLASVMEGLKRSLNILQAGPDLPLQIVGKAIGSRVGGGRTGGVEKVLRSALSQYDLRARQPNYYKQIIPTLKALSQCAEELWWQFHPSIIQVRCLLWTLSRALTLEAKLLLSCANALSPWSVPKGVTRRENSIGHKLFTVLFIPHVLIWRVTFDLVEDAASLVSDTPRPPPALGAIFKIVKDSTSLSLAFCIDGNLDKCKLTVGPSSLFTFENRTAKENWVTSHLECLELALRSDGDSLRGDETRRQLLEFYYSIKDTN